MCLLGVGGRRAILLLRKIFGDLICTSLYEEAVTVLAH